MARASPTRTTVAAITIAVGTSSAFAGVASASSDRIGLASGGNAAHEPAVVLLQNGEGAHYLAAAVGIVVLALLGGVLVARNRLSSAGSPAVSGIERNEEDFVSDREKVCKLVKRNGGRMKQSDIVDSVEWSKAKVSRLLADLEEENEVTKLRLGRENLICLDGYEPAASQPSETPEGE